MILASNIITSGSVQEDRKLEEVSRARGGSGQIWPGYSHFIGCCAVRGSGRFLSFHDSPLLLFVCGVHLLFAW